MMRPWKLEWQYLQHSGKFTKWRCFATYKTEASAEKALKAQSERWRMPTNFRVISPTSPPPEAPPKVRSPE